MQHCPGLKLDRSRPTRIRHTPAMETIPTVDIAAWAAPELHSDAQRRATAAEWNDAMSAVGFGVVGSPRSFASSMTRPVGSQHLPSLLPQLRLGHEMPIAA